MDSQNSNLYSHVLISFMHKSIFVYPGMLEFHIIIIENLPYVSMFWQDLAGSLLLYVWLPHQRMGI